MTQKQTEKLTITFDLEDPQDAKIYQELEETFQFLSSLHYGPSLSKSDILKNFFKRPLDEEMIQYKQDRITHEQKISMWVQGHNNLNKTEIDKFAFIVEVLPNLNKKQLKDIEKAAIQYVQ